MGKLIVIEGTDGSGKATQTKKLCDRLTGMGHNLKRLEFPRYEEPSSALVRLYLNGAFGSRADDVNPYAASTFFAVDRFASFKQDWERFYESGGIVITDRYTTSNAVHQAPKLPEEKREDFVNWLFDFEYRLMGLPRPELVVYLDMPPAVSEELMRQRERATNTAGDIHEIDEEYLKRCRDYSLSMAERNGWHVVNCAGKDGPRTVEDIHEEIFSAVSGILEV